MSLDSVLAQLNERNITLKADNGELGVRAAKGAVTPDILALLRQHKAALLEWVLARQQPSSESTLAMTPLAAGAPWPLSFGQRRLWIIEQLGDSAGAFNMPFALRLQGPLDHGALQRSFSDIVERHQVLRARVVAGADGPMLAVAAEWNVDLPLTDLRALAPHERELHMLALARRDAVQPFDLAQAPLLRLQLYQLGEHEHVLLLNAHHIACDGWSMGIVVRELTHAYRVHCGAAAPELPPLPVQYGDFAAWQQRFLSGAVLERMLGYWKNKLQGLPPLLELPTDRARPPEQTYAGAAMRFQIDGAVADRLNALARRSNASVFMVLLAAFNVLLARYSGQTDIAVGSPCAGRDHPQLEPLIGFFVNSLVLRADLASNPRFTDLIEQVRQTTLDAYDHQQVPFERLVEALRPERSLGHAPLFQVWFAFQNTNVGQLQLDGLTLAPVSLGAVAAQFDLSLQMEQGADGFYGSFEFNTDLFDLATIERLSAHFAQLLATLSTTPGQRVFEAPLMPAAERAALLAVRNDSALVVPQGRCVHQLFEDQAAARPSAIALECGSQQLSYVQLDARANALAARLRVLGVGVESRVGVLLGRSAEMVISLLAILKTGAAYVPLDPSYPRERLVYIAAHAGISVLVTEQAYEHLLAENGALRVYADLPCASAAPQDTSIHPLNAAYVIYTSGSTGQPKGVAVSHRNVINFMHGMDRSLQIDAFDDGRRSCLAVTSMSFDISVLELFWTLAHGYRVVLQPDLRAAVASEPAAALKFGLFYFASDEDSQAGNKYRLLLEGAKFADDNGFSSVWVPERHFHAFGGQFPNPSVAAAAVAAITSRIGIRSGSVVLPLHDPLRVAEEWSMVDNLSNGRVGLSFASGWHFNDFVFAPQNYQDRFQVMQKNVEVVRKLWRGESIVRQGGTGKDVDIAIRPRPIQRELPVWVTAANSPETFRFAGASGSNVLTHLLGQSIDELKEKVAIYRQARAQAGHDPLGGEVSVMIHTYVAEDEASARAVVSEPFKNYLRSSLNLIKPMAESMGLDADAHTDVLVEAGFQRFYTTGTLFGTPDSCLPLLRRLKDAGATEIACLVDFGVAVDLALAQLPLLAQLHRRIADLFRQEAEQAAPVDMAAPVALLEASGADILQCTPSYARLLLQEPGGAQALRRVDKLLLGGEAVPPTLVDALFASGSRAIYNMYGPTETTVWSAVQALAPRSGDQSSIGAPIANTQLYVLDAFFEPVPYGVAGELYIGGDGVTRGYWTRPDITAERYLPDPFCATPGARMYRSGDKVRQMADGRMLFLGRLDNQLKIGGFRIEAGEVEAALNAHPDIAESAVMAQDDGHGNRRLAAYLVLKQDATADIGALREALKARLPHYMVPAVFSVLDAMPLTPNGKVDRKALPAIGAAAAPARVYIAPRTDTEARLARIWSELLKVEQVSADDNFFEIGGHSLLATQLNPRIRDEFQVELSIRFLFASPVVADIAMRIDLLLHEKATELRQSEVNDMEETEF